MMPIEYDRKGFAFQNSSLSECDTSINPVRESSEAQSREEPLSQAACTANLCYASNLLNNAHTTYSHLIDSYGEARKLYMKSLKRECPF